MSAIARYFHSQNLCVKGYDKVETSLTNSLISEGIEIHFEDNTTYIPSDFKVENTIVIYTPAIPQNHSEYNYLKNNGYKVIKRAEALGIITENNISIAIAGTHGKTTTSSLVAHILKDSPIGCNAFLGGITSNYNTNYLENKSSNIAVVEADEFDRSFLKLSPNMSLITSTDADHLDIYGKADDMVKSFNDFAKLSSDLLIYKKGLQISTKGKTYSIEDASANYFADNISISNHQYQFDLVIDGQFIQNIKTGLPGRHNVENALGAIALTNELGIEINFIAEKIESFKGVKRRFEYQINTKDVVYIDDYAHHPEELKAFINSAKELYPTKKITGVFQPHLYSRTKDFVNEFATSLNLLDKLFLLDIYPARELPIEGVSSEWLLNKIDLENKELITKENAISKITYTIPEVLLTMGAGDINTLVKPIKESLLNQTESIA